ncbi:hypothetical protein IKG33_03210 [Candidatus Saccharibacteria bacterium]|nr:hypothetical protein [Candidatus Saccharibacteria bacterium]
MQPENNGPEGQRLETAVKEVTEVEARPIANEPVKSDIVFNDKPKKSGGMILGMVLFAILAAGGIGFGVWAMMDGNAQKEQLNEQINTLKTQNNELMDKLGAAGSGSNTTDETTTLNVNTADYIYVGEWGIKIKIPEGKSSEVSYLFSAEDYLEILDSGKNYTYGQEVDWNSVNDLMISRSEKGTVDFEGCLQSCSKYITTIGNYDYAYLMQGSNLELLESSFLNEMNTSDAFSSF